MVLNGINILSVPLKKNDPSRQMCGDWGVSMTKIHVGMSYLWWLITRRGRLLEGWRYLGKCGELFSPWWESSINDAPPMLEVDFFCNTSLIDRSWNILRVRLGLCLRKNPKVNHTNWYVSMIYYMKMRISFVRFLIYLPFHIPT